MRTFGDHQHCRGNLTFGDEKVEHGQHHRVPTEHVIAAGSHTLDRQATADPNEKGLVDPFGPGSVGL